MASSLYILNQKGQVLIYRNYREENEESENLITYTSKRFLSKLSEQEDNPTGIKPVLYDEERGMSFIYILLNDLFFLCVTSQNTNATMYLLFLHQMAKILQQTFKQLDEERIKDNFVLVYEMIDEMMDFGYPQLTECHFLKDYISQKIQVDESISVNTKNPLPSPSSSDVYICTRGSEIKYRKNEIFLDIIEKVNYEINSNGSIVSSNINGMIKVNSYLSGIPEVRVYLNNHNIFPQTFNKNNQSLVYYPGIELDDVCFNQCVRLSKYEKEKTIDFIPNESIFDLMSYVVRNNQHMKGAPLMVEREIQYCGHSRILYSVKIRCHLKSHIQLKDISIKIPIHSDVDSPNFKTNIGKVNYLPESDQMIWNICYLNGGMEYTMNAEFGLPSIDFKKESQNHKIPIRVMFSIDNYSLSSIKIKYVKIAERQNYKYSVWVRYFTQSDQYYIRV